VNYKRIATKEGEKEGKEKGERHPFSLGITSDTVDYTWIYQSETCILILVLRGISCLTSRKTFNF